MGLNNHAGRHESLLHMFLPRGCDTEGVKQKDAGQEVVKMSCALGCDCLQSARQGH